ncbi:MAG TPA: hypothetical protein VF170_19730, partial [Planctomycetaceae bacterium]
MRVRAARRVGLIWVAAVQLAAALCLLSPAAWADEGDPLASSEDDLFALDEDDLFGAGGDLLVEVEDSKDGGLEEAFLVSDRPETGGTYRLSAGAAWAWAGGSGPPARTSSAAVGGTFFIDARPRRDFRLFGKVKGDAALDGEAQAGPVLKLHELFADFDVGDKAFFRVGKQTVNWGVGYFFSPADIINVGRIDPEHPEAEREGPVALRVNVPTGSDNLYAYAVYDDSAAGTKVAFAPKAEFVIGGSEVGLGLYYRAGRAPRAMATLSTSLGKVSLFGEAVLSKGSDKRFVKEAAVTPGN